MDYVWVFNGERSQLPSAVFSSREKAEQWIQDNRLNGLLTLFPVDMSAYEWSIEQGYFTPKHDGQRTPEFIQRFSGGHEHHHYENGERQV